MALKLTTKQFDLLFGDAQLIDTRFPETVSAEESLKVPSIDTPPDSSTSYCLRVGATMPVAVLWTWNHGSWGDSGALTPAKILELINSGKAVYTQPNEHAPATRILRCTPLMECEAYFIRAKTYQIHLPERVRHHMTKNKYDYALLPGHIITDGTSSVYDKVANAWLTVSELAEESPMPYLGTHLLAERCECELYELELAACADVYLPGQLKATSGGVYSLGLPDETWNALKTFDLLPLRPTLTRTTTYQPMMKIHDGLIGLLPLNNPKDPIARAKNMKLYHVLHWVVKNDFRSCYASTVYYLAPSSSVAPYGAFVFLGEAHDKCGVSSAEQLEDLKNRLLKEELTPSVYLFSNSQGEVRQEEGIAITAPCQPCTENPLELLDTLHTRKHFTLHTPWFARDHLNKLAEVSYEYLSFSLHEYERIFSPGKSI